jgi:hypothetical protein
MSAEEPGVDQRPTGAASLFERAKNLILKPDKEWEKIAAERTSVRELYVGWIIPLLAIPFVAGMIGRIIMGYGSASFSASVSPVEVIIDGVIVYALGLGSVYVIAMAIDSVAEYFGGKRDFMSALKLSAYAPTALALSGVFFILPGLLSMLSVVGLYSVYTFYRGLPALMKAPEENAMGYAATIIVIAVVLGIVAMMLSACVTMG